MRIHQSENRDAHSVFPKVHHILSFTTSRGNMYMYQDLRFPKILQILCLLYFTCTMCSQEGHNTSL